MNVKYTSTSEGNDRKSIPNIVFQELSKLNLQIFNVFRINHARSMLETCLQDIRIQINGYGHIFFFNYVFMRVLMELSPFVVLIRSGPLWFSHLDLLDLNPTGNGN